MLIRVQNEIFSIEGIERTLYFKHNKEGKIFCKINYKLKNAIKIPEWKQYDEPELEILELEKSKKGAFDLRHVQTEAIFWNWILKGDFYFDGEKLQITPASWVSFLVKEVQYARRYTKESQFKELKRYFDMIWEQDSLVLIEFPHPTDLEHDEAYTTKMVVIAENEEIESRMSALLKTPVQEVCKVKKVYLRDKGKLFFTLMDGYSVLSYAEIFNRSGKERKIGCSKVVVKRFPELDKTFEGLKIHLPHKLKKNHYALVKDKDGKTVYIGKSKAGKWFVAWEC